MTQILLMNWSQEVSVHPPRFKKTLELMFPESHMDVSDPGDTLLPDCLPAAHEIIEVQWSPKS